MARFCDADLTGDKKDCKSTRGEFLAIVGPATYFPLSAICRKQGCESDSTCEAGIDAMTLGLKQAGLPAVSLWEALA